MSTEKLKLVVQRFGRSLSNMVMPNIGAFIAWGLITACFIADGWFPHPSLARLVTPMITYLLPLLIAHTGGSIVAGERGGVVGAIATIGIIVGSDIPMFLGAMLMGPLGGYLIHQFDRRLEPHIPTGFEMLVNNFSAGIVGALLACLSFVAIGPCVTLLSKTLAHGVQYLVQHRLLPLTAIFVEPAKVFFLNNAINHGIFSPLGIQQSSESGLSPFFLRWFGRGDARSTSLGAALLLAVIAGGMVGSLVLICCKAGLISAASPGSILAVLMMTPKQALFGVLLSIALATATSFFVAMIILSNRHGYGCRAARPLPPRKDPRSSNDSGQDSLPVSAAFIRTIAVACDAGMGSSAMGANLQDLTDRAREASPQAHHRSLQQFLDGKFYDALVAELQAQFQPRKTTEETKGLLLTEEQIFLQCPSCSKEEAILQAGNALMAMGSVTEEYIYAMLEREKLSSTYLGEGIATPHGTTESKGLIKKTGMVIFQYPEGVLFTNDPDEKAYFVIGIAAKGDEHIQLLTQITRTLDQPERLHALQTCQSPAAFLQLLTQS